MSKKKKIIIWVIVLIMLIFFFFPKKMTIIYEDSDRGVPWTYQTKNCIGIFDNGHYVGEGGYPKLTCYGLTYPKTHQAGYCWDLKISKRFILSFYCF